MEKFQWIKLLCSCILYFSLCYKATTIAIDIEDGKVYLNITEPYIDVKVNETIYIKCSGRPPLKWDYENPLKTGVAGYTEEVFDFQNESSIRLTFNHQKATGRYFCRNNFYEASIYIFVNGAELILSHPLIIIVQKNKYIPCVPTVSGAKMTLWKESTPVPLEFDPTKGFLFNTTPKYSTEMYKCVAEYGGKNESDNVIVEVPKPTTAKPSIYIDESNATNVLTGSSFSLTCYVRTDAEAFVDIEWSSPPLTTTEESETLDEHITGYLSVSKTLQILNATERHTGSYRCTALDHSEKANSAEVNITVYDTEDYKVSLNITEPYIDVKVDETIYIKCSGRPPLKWDYENPMKTGVAGYTKKVFGSKNESTIRLTFNHQEATGRYICKNNFAEASIYIFVNGDRLMLFHPHTIIVPVDKYIPCILTVSGGNMTLWKDSELVPLEFDKMKGFFFNKITDSSSSEDYECVATYDNKTEIEYVTVEVPKATTAIPLVYIDEANSTYILAGLNFSLTCFVRTDADAFIDINWNYPTKGTARKPKVVEKSNRDETYLNVSKSLHILNATERDTGFYRCTALDHSDRKNFAEVKVTVYETPPPPVLTFQEEIEKIIRNKNENADLIANYEVFPPTTVIQTKWSKDDAPIVSNFKHTSGQTNYFLKLKITGLNGNDSGLYTVTANASGFIAKKSFLLQVRDKPLVDVSSNPSCCFSPGRQYNLSCEVKGYPSSNITWLWKPFCINETSQCNSSNDANSWSVFQSYYGINNSTVKKTTRGRSSISNLSVVANQSGLYKCVAENQMGVTEEEKLFVVSDIEKGFEIISTKNPKDNTRLTAICKASLVLYSELQWKRISNLTNERETDSTVKSVISEAGVSLQTELDNIVESDIGKYVCVATSRNTGMPEEKLISVDMKGPSEMLEQGSQMNKNLILIPTFLGIFLIIIVAICLIRININKKKKKVSFQDFNHHFLEGKMALFDSNLPLDEQVDLLPYDETWEFPREKLKLGRTLGQGAFGRVVKAEAFEISEDGASTIVAVKMLKERTDRNQQKSLMDELKILIHLGHHVNIVNLMGAVTKNIQKDGSMVIVEYCRYGNIRHYLQRNRDKFINEIDMQSGKMISNGDFFFTDYGSSHGSNSELVHNSSSSSSGVFSVHNPNYRRIRGKIAICSDPRGSDCSHMQYLGSSSTSSGSVFRSYSRSDSQDSVVTTNDLLCFAFQCSRGMDYLASRKLIHRDLAARNILLAEGKIVKICDFGLAKDCYKYSNYVKKGDGPLPIKWMSIESIWDHVFTTKSDVWSFGILMWEFFTLGGNPYPGLDINEHFYKKLKSGYRMEKPELCPAFAYQIMRDCWNADPDKRPDFNQISEMLGNSLEENIKQHYIDVNEPYMEMNRKMKSPFYSNVERLEGEDAVLPYVNSRVQDIAPHYDVPPRVRSLLDEPVPNEPMEVVPMIQLELNTNVLCDIRNNDETAKLQDTKKSNTLVNFLEKGDESP